jgi:hypothetical protein
MRRFPHIDETNDGPILLREQIVGVAVLNRLCDAGVRPSIAINTMEDPWQKPHMMLVKLAIQTLNAGNIGDRSLSYVHIVALPQAPVILEKLITGNRQGGPPTASRANQAALARPATGFGPERRTLTRQAVAARNARGAHYRHTKPAGNGHSTPQPRNGNALKRRVTVCIGRMGAGGIEPLVGHLTCFTDNGFTVRREEQLPSL